MWPNPQVTVNLTTSSEEISNGEPGEWKFYVQRYANFMQITCIALWYRLAYYRGTKHLLKHWWNENIETILSNNIIFREFFAEI